MSLLLEIMGEGQSVINDILGRPCELKNGATGDVVRVDVVIRNDVELYQQHQFAGVVTTGTFALADSSPLIGDELYDMATGISYQLDGIKTETPYKREFILREL